MSTYYNHIAVYGTLRNGKVMAELGCNFIRQIKVPGILVDCGAFPAFVAKKAAGCRWFARSQYGEVLCDLYKFPEDRDKKIEVIRAFDQYENFLYNRIVLTNSWREQIGEIERNGTVYPKYKYHQDFFYIYTARDWVVDGATQIPGNPADWLEWVRRKDHE